MVSKFGGRLALAEAERHVADGERRVTEQEIRFQELRRTGQDTREAERLLVNLLDLLGQFCAHRDEILHKQAQTPDFKLVPYPPEAN